MTGPDWFLGAFAWGKGSDRGGYDLARADRRYATQAKQLRPSLDLALDVLTARHQRDIPTRRFLVRDRGTFAWVMTTPTWRDPGGRKAHGFYVVLLHAEAVRALGAIRTWLPAAITIDQVPTWPNVEEPALLHSAPGLPVGGQRLALVGSAWLAEGRATDGALDRLGRAVADGADSAVALLDPIRLDEEPVWDWMRGGRVLAVDAGSDPSELRARDWVLVWPGEALSEVGRPAVAVGPPPEEPSPWAPIASTQVGPDDLDLGDPEPAETAFREAPEPDRPYTWRSGSIEHAAAVWSFVLGGILGSLTTLVCIGVLLGSDPYHTRTTRPAIARGCVCTSADPEDLPWLDARSCSFGANP